MKHHPGSFAIISCALSLLAGCSAPANATPAPRLLSQPGADLGMIKTYLPGRASTLIRPATALKVAGAKYYDLAGAANFDHAASWSAGPAQVSAALSEAKTARMAASPVYEQMEGIVAGAAIALLAVVLVGMITFRLQKTLPYMKILVVTGVLIGGVLLQIVGSTAHIVQLIGWLPVQGVPGISLPYWAGTWFGMYGTWEGIGLQVLSAGVVIGSYYLARWMQDRRIPRSDQVRQTRLS